MGPGFTNKVEERGGVGMIFINEMKGMEVRLDFIPLDAWTPNRKLSTVRRPPQHAHICSLISVSFDVSGPGKSKESERRLSMATFLGGLLTIFKTAVGCPRTGLGCSVGTAVG